MRLARRVLLLLLFFALAGGVWAAIYGKKKGFYETWRTLVEDEFATQTGFYTKIDKVTLGPLQGLVAEKVLFYWDPERRRKFASVDSIILDLDLTEIMNRDLSINTLDVRDAKLWLPLSPGKGNSETLEVDHFSGRLVVTESQIEIVKALADLKGIEITLKGSLHRAPLERGVPSEEADIEEVEQQKKVQETVLHIGNLVLDQIDRMKFDPFGRPRLEAEFSGELNDLGGLRATARLTAENFERGSYAVQKLSASMEYNGEKGRATLKELHLRDSRGDLRLRADWPIGGKEITFDLDSNADLKALVASIYPNPKLGEVNFFKPPRLKMEGTIELDGIEDAKWPALPLEAIGQFSSDSIGSRGMVFDGLEFNFSVSGDRSYVRNLRLEHKTGTLLANLMYDPALGPETFRYQSEMKMDPKVFLPFVKSPNSRRFLSLWDFNRNANIYVAAMGSGPDLDPDHWYSRGLVDFRRLRMNNVRFNRFEADFEFGGRTQTYRNVRLAGANGLVQAPEARFYARTGKWEVTDLKWSLDLVEGARAFSPDLAEELKHHQFTARPEMKIDGIIDARSKMELGDRSRQHDFRLEFESDQPLDYEFLGETFSLQNPEGTVTVKGARFDLTDFTAGLFGGKIEAEFHFVDGVRKKGALTIRNADVFSIPPFRNLAPVIGDAIPGAEADLSDAKEMSVTLEFSDGVFLTDNLEAKTATTRLSANGRIDSDPKTIQLEATVETGASDPETGKSIRFRGEGPFANPEWKVDRSDP